MILLVIPELPNLHKKSSIHLPQSKTKTNTNSQIPKQSYTPFKHKKSLGWWVGTDSNSLYLNQINQLNKL